MIYNLLLVELNDVEYYRDLEILVRGHSRSFENGDVRYTIYDFLLVGHCNYLVLFSSYLVMNDIVTLTYIMG